MKQAFELYDNLSLPKSLRNERNASAILLLLKPTKVIQNGEVILNCQVVMKSFLNEIYLTFFHIFRVNNKKKRGFFFNEALV